MVDLKLKRTEKGHMTQTELSERSGVNRTSISNIECGKIVPSTRTAKKLAAVLGFDWREFYDE